MNKKAVELRTITIILILLVFFIGVWFLGPYAKASTLKDSLKNIFPSFSSQRPLQEGVGRIRYDIPNDKVQYYDGTKWLDFQNEKIPFSEKTIESQKLLEDFTSYYYGRSQREKQFIPLNFNSGKELYEDQKYGVDFCLLFSDILLKNRQITNQEDDSLREDLVEGLAEGLVDPIFQGYFSDIYQNGDISIILLLGDARGRCESRKVYGLFTFKTDGRLFFSSINEEKFFSEPSDITRDKMTAYREISEKAIKWRDSVFSKLIPIRYLAERTEKIAFYCPEKNRDFIFIDLAIVKEEGDICNG